MVLLTVYQSSYIAEIDKTAHNDSCQFMTVMAQGRVLNRASSASLFPKLQQSLLWDMHGYNAITVIPRQLLTQM